MKQSRASSDKEHFLQRIHSEVESRPELSGKVKIEVCPDEDDIDVHVVISMAGPTGFDVHIQFFDRWEVNVLGDECIEDFLLVDKAKFSGENRRKVDAAIDLAFGLLGTQYRLRQLYRGGRFRKGFIEEQEDGQWKSRACRQQLLWFRDFFGEATERILQNGILQ